MSESNEHIWNYLDQAATPEERAELERRRQEDPVFRQDFLEREALDAQLKTIEAEQPSLRFVQNIMDRLPELYRRAVEPLVRPLWIKVFAGTMSVCLLGYLGFVYYAVQTGQIEPGGSLVTISNKINGLFSGLSGQVISIVAALSLGYLGLVLFDRVLKKRLLKKA